MSYSVQQGLQNESANQVLAGPTSGAAANPAYRALVPADIPLGGVNAQTASYAAVVGDYSKLISMNGSSLTLTLPNPAPNVHWYILVENTNASNLTVAHNSLSIDGVASDLTVPQNQGVLIFTDGTNYFTCRGLPASGGGTVTSVAMTGDGVIFNSTVGGSPITTSGTLVPALLTQSANKFLGGPTSGAAATPTFRLLSAIDIPSGVNSQTISYTALAADNGKLITMNGSSLTLTLPSSPPSATWWIAVENTAATSLTVSRNGLNIDGAASNLTLTQNQGVFIFTDGSNYFTSRGMGSGSSLSLQVNGTPNGSQTLLNLAAGTNMTVTDNGSGTVTFASSAGTGAGGVNSQTTNYTALSGDTGKLIVMNGSNLTLTLPASPPTSIWFIFVENLNSTSLTISRHGLNIDGAASNIILDANQGIMIFTDGSNYFTSRGVTQILSADTPPATVLVENEEFNSSTLDAKWTVNTNSGVTSSLNGTIPGSLWIKTGTGNTNGYALTEAVTSVTGNVAFTMRCGATPTANFNGVFLDVYDSNTIGTNTLEILWGKNGNNQITCNKYVASVQTAVASQQLTTFPLMGPIYLHIQRKSSVWGFWYSLDGGAFAELGTTSSLSTTAIVNLRISVLNNGSTTPMTAWVDWVRRDWIDLM